jgi:PAS domain S-box-containing protein
MDVATVLDSMAVGVFVADTTGDVVHVNATGLSMFGARDLADLKSRSPAGICNVRDENGRPIPADRMPIQRALAGEEDVRQLELFDNESGSTRALRTRTNPMRGPDGAIIGAVKVVADITRELECPSS